MARSAKALLAEASLKALALSLLTHPLGLCCALVLSALPEGLTDNLTEELAKIVGIAIAEHLTEVEPGSLPEAFLKALQNALARVRQERWAEWFNNWDEHCKKIKHHRWKNLRQLTLAIGNLNDDPSDWPVLQETLVLLDWSARILSESAANRGEMPGGLSELLRAHLGAAFIEELKDLLSKPEYARAHVDTTVELASLAAAAAARPTGRRPLLGADDPRLRPMRNFFTGRNADVEAVTTHLSGDGNFAVVTGGPGIGKTELGKAALRAHLRDHPETRAYYIEVTGVRNVEELQVALAAALGNPTLAEDPIALLRELRSESDLIYLDNLEDALPEQTEAAAKVFGWLEDMVQYEIKLLASSRRLLGSVAQEFPLDRLSLEESKELFEHFWTTSEGSAIEDAAAFEHFLEHDLDRHALTIRLLALQGREWKTWQTLRVQWQKRKTKLAEDAGRRDRLSSLDVSISLTFDQIKKDPTATDIWIAFACFPDGMSPAAQAAVAPDEAQRDQALRLLRNMGVIYLPEAEAGDHFEMLAPLRQFAIALDPPATKPVWERCLKYFETVVRWAESTQFSAGDQRRDAMQLLFAEFGNLKESLILAVDKKVSPYLVEQIHHVLLNSYRFQPVASRDILVRLDDFFHAESRVTARATTVAMLGDLEMRLGRVAEARRRYDEALPLFASRQNDMGRANTLRSLGDLESRLGHMEEARRRYDEALPLFVSAQNNLGRANVLLALGDLERELERVEEARGRYDEALPLYVADKNNLGRANTLLSLGDLERGLERVEEARRYYDEALALYVSEKDDLGRANTLKALADLELTEDPRKAEGLYEEALKLFDGELIGSGLTLATLATLYKRSNRSESAVDAAQRARAAAQASSAADVVKEVEDVLKRAGL